MEVICIEIEAFYRLVKSVLERVDNKPKEKDRWIDSEEALRLLRIKSMTTLSSLRLDGHIRYSQPSKKIILYDRQSIEEYIEKHAKNPFR